MREEDADMSARLRRYLDDEDRPGDLDLLEPDDLEPCPSCGALSDAPAYAGHGMGCVYFWREADPRGT
jgi:hypothetical protein